VLSCFTIAAKLDVFKQRQNFLVHEYNASLYVLVDLCKGTEAGSTADNGVMVQVQKQKIW
jgi:hypothetical protein